MGRVKFKEIYGFLDAIGSRWMTRYGVAVALVALTGLLGNRFGEQLGVEFYLLLLFGTVLAATVVGGLGPGLLATGLAAYLGHEVPRERLSLDLVRLLVIEGTLVSLGGAFRVAIVNTNERLKIVSEAERRMVEFNDQERQRIGADLHDGLGQHLTGISLLSETLAQRLEATGRPNLAEIETISRLVQEAIVITRSMAKSLSPIALEVGLSTALKDLAETSSRIFGIRCVCEVEGRELESDPIRSLHLYRIVQEAVNNAVRHGKAGNVLIAVSYKNNELTVKVIDNGSGLPQQPNLQQGLGLRIMHHRARIIGALLNVERVAPEGGTVVSCICPMESEARQSLRNGRTFNRVESEKQG